MAINLVSTIVNIVTANATLTLLPVGTYRIQEMQIMVPAVNVTGAGAYSYQGALISGNNTVQIVEFVSNSAAGGFTTQNNATFNISFADPLILTPNSTLIFKCISSVNITGLRVLTNISGFKS